MAEGRERADTGNILMSMDTSGLRFPKGRSGLLRRHQRKVADKAALDAAYAQVEAREANRSQVSGSYLVAGHVDPLRRMSHHHITKRSHDRALIADPDNIFLCSHAEHMLIEGHRIIIEGTNALTYRVHWAEDIKAHEKIVKIRSRRWSQEEDA